MSESSPLERIGPLPRGALRHGVVHRLLAAIVSGELAAGTRLAAKRLAERLGVSATPIREALVELEQMGIVQILHNRGAVVRPLGRTEVHDIYHLRRILECEAVRCSCGRLALTALARLKDELEGLLQQPTDDVERWLRNLIDHDQRLHGLILDHCGNGRLRDEIRRQQSLFQALTEALGDRISIHREMVAGHKPIIEALLASDASEAAEAMAMHVNSVCGCVEETLFNHEPPKS
ncbi:MAG: GntR family transcriptional regulator [Thermoguttaceae bacterium]